MISCGLSDRAALQCNVGLEVGPNYIGIRNSSMREAWIWHTSGLGRI
jgi:hypothetical protein